MYVISTGLPIAGLHPDAEQRGAVEDTAARLRELGHEVFDRELDYGLTMGNRVLARFVKGVGDKAVQIGHRERLSRRAKGLARIGTSIPDRVVAGAAARAAADAERINAIFAHADVVLYADGWVETAVLRPDAAATTHATAEVDSAEAFGLLLERVVELITWSGPDSRRKPSAPAGPQRAPQWVLGFDGERIGP